MPMAISTRDSSFRPVTSFSAPALSRATAVSTCPFVTAASNGAPPLPPLSTSPPAAISILTVAVCPFSAAALIGVKPPAPVASGKIPAVSNRRTALPLPSPACSTSASAVTAIPMASSFFSASPSGVEQAARAITIHKRPVTKNTFFISPLEVDLIGTNVCSAV